MRILTLAFPQIKTQKNTKSQSIAHLNLAFLAMLAILLVTYLIEINSLSTRGFQIRKLEQNISALELAQKHLQLEASSMQSINRIEQEARKLNLVPSTNVTYIKEADFALK